MLRDARAEVLAKISLACGFQVKEETLSPEVRQAISSLASTYKGLTVIRQLLLVEEKDSRRISTRLKRSVESRDQKDIQAYFGQIDQLHKSLSDQIVKVAKAIDTQMGMKMAPGEAPVPGEAVNVKIEELKCKNCGAPLKPPVDFVAKCAYCGAEYELSEYLSRLDDSIRGVQAPPEQPAEGSPEPKTAEGK